MSLVQYSQHTLDERFLHPVFIQVRELIVRQVIPQNQFTFRFGWTQNQNGMIFELDNTRFEYLFDEIKRFWRLHYPLFKWSQIVLHVNHCPRLEAHSLHLLQQTIMVIGFGNYSGGGMKIIPCHNCDNLELQVIPTKNMVTIFNYQPCCHYQSMPATEGTKLELVMYGCRTIPSFSAMLMLEEEKTDEPEQKEGV